MSRGSTHGGGRESAGLQQAGAAIFDSYTIDVFEAPRTVAAESLQDLNEQVLANFGSRMVDVFEAQRTVAAKSLQDLTSRILPSSVRACSISSRL